MSLRVRGIVLGLGIGALSLATGRAGAAEPLAWKFTPGATNRYRLTQDLTVTMIPAAGGEVATTARNSMDMTMTVAETKDDGSAVIKQKFDRIRMSVQVAGGPAAEFDTQSTAEAEGFAALVAPLLREMARSEFTLTMTPRGEIKDVEIPEAMLRALAGSPGAQALGDLATAEGFQRSIRGAAFELPEKLDAGEQWTTTSEMENPLLGKQTITTVYRYVGPREVDGAACEEFAVTLEVSFAGREGVTVQSSEQTSSGTALFNRTAGRIQSTEMDHSLKLTIVAGGQSTSQSIKQVVRFEWLPEDAE
jgi:hypothetical protein